MAKALINEKMLSWALKRSNLSVEELAARMNTSDSRVDTWLKGDERPTFKQAQRVAQILQIPFGFLYLPAPPKEQVPIAEFRRLPGAKRNLDRDVYDLLLDIDFKRDWYREFREGEGSEPLEFVGRFNVDSPISLVAADIRRELSTESNSLFGTRKTPDRFLDELIKAAEKIGIWVMESGVVGNNTHRPIPVEVLRGFAIADKMVPLIFLNGKDSKSAQIFTFAHELAHLWVGRSSIEQGDLSHVTSSGDQVVEVACNKIAAEILVPRAEFMEQWNKEIMLSEQVNLIAERFSVSRIVVARRALEQDLIDVATYREFYASEANRWAKSAVSQSAGGSYYAVIPVRNGRDFTRVVTKEAASGRLMYRDAAQLLGVQPSKVRELHERSHG